MADYAHRSRDPAGTRSAGAKAGVKSDAKSPERLALLENRPEARVKAEHERLLNGRAAARQQPVPRAPPNRTGLPDRLKAGVESLSGHSLDGVRVHYNSSEPARLNALAYTQGSDIHVGPGQEKHLPHEAWHVVQQKQGRVRATVQMKEGVPINDDPVLEREADLMGARAAAESSGAEAESAPALSVPGPAHAPRQLRRDTLRPKSGPYLGAVGVLHDMAGKLDDSTMRGHATISTELKKVKEGATITLKNFPSSSPERAAHWISVLGKKSESLKAAAGGYMIEDIVSAEFRGTPGYTAQHVMSRARPDFLIEAEAKGQKARGVVDITSLKQAGHVWDKKFQQSSFDYVAECVYPPLPFDGLLNDVKLDPLSVKEVQAIQLAHANKLFAHHIFVLWQTFDLHASSKKEAGPIRAMLTQMKKVNDEGRVTPQAIADIDKEITKFNATYKTEIDLVGEVVEMIRAKYGLEGFPPTWVGEKEAQEEKKSAAPVSSSVPAPLRAEEPPTDWRPWLYALGIAATVVSIFIAYM